MITNLKHIDQLAAIIQKVSGLYQLEAADLAQAILRHPDSLWQPPAALTQLEVGEVGEQEIEAFIHQWWEDFGRGYLPNSSDKALVAAALAHWGRPPASSSLPANYIDPEHQGGDLKLLQTFYQACHTEGGTVDEIYLRGLRAVLAARPATPPAPESTWAEFIRELARIQYVAQGEGRGPRFDLVIAAKALVLPVVEAERASGEVTSPCLTASDTQRLIEALDFCVGNSDYRPNSGNHHALLERLKSSAAPPAPEPGEEVGLLVAELRRLERYAMDKGSDHGDWLDAAVELDRAATWLQQLSAPAPAVVPVAVSERLPDRRPESEGGDCDAEGRCWWFSPSAFWPRKIRSCWTLDSEAMEGDTHWRPFRAIPIPQAGEVEA
jgi:hypothetical protein